MNSKNNKNRVQTKKQNSNIIIVKYNMRNFNKRSIENFYK